MASDAIGKQTDWQAHYLTTLAAAEQRLKRKSRVACGFTNNVDVRLKLDEEAKRVLAGVAPNGPAGQRPRSIDSPADVVNCLLYHMPRGTGDVLTITSASTAKWIEERFHGPLQLGGTGAQAANTLAHLGYETVLHVTSLSAIDATVFNDAERIFVAAPGGLRPLVDAIDPHARPMYHHVFEYQTGDELNAWGAHVTALKANRIILEFDAVNHVLPINPLFMDAIADPASAVTRVLISGFTQVDTAAIARARIATTIEHVRHLRAVRPDLIFHLELASVTYPELLPPIIEAMALHADSLGLNEQEIGLVAEAWQWAQPQSIAEQIETLAHIRARTGVRRVGLHTQEYCLTLTEFAPQTERHSLLFASLVAGARARLGRFPTMRDLHDTLASGQVSASGLAVEQRLKEMLCPRSLTACPGLTINEGIGRYEDTWVICAPTLSISHPAGTVGLGDSFTGGVLVFLDGNRVFTEMPH